MSRKKIIIYSLLLIITALVLIYHDLIIYGIRQGIGQLEIVYKARPVEEILGDDNVDQETKNKLRIVEEVRRYAINNLHLNDTDNYTEVYDQGGKPLLWVVTACEPFQFVPYEWKFPIVGTVPYKGFFNNDLAKETAAELNEKGLDVNIRTVGGWSTLGWFKDPILSDMLKRDHGDLANLIIHELVHATIFVKDSVEFNENLASFIADKGVEQYLTDEYGANDELLINYENNKQDQQAFITHILKGYTILDSLYVSIQNDAENEKLKLKSDFIDSIMVSLDTIDFHDRNYLENIKGYHPNNAYFMSFKRYRSKQNILDSIYRYQFDSNLITFVEYLKNKHSKD